MSGEPPRKFIRSYEDLDVFQRSMDALLAVHRVVLAFPDYEKFDLANQLRRASKSIPANIAEGYGKKRSAREFRAYLTNALGSATELEVHLKIARKLEYISDEDAKLLIHEYQIIGKQLFRLIQHWQKFDPPPPTSHLPEPDGDE